MDTRILLLLAVVALTNLDLVQAIVGGKAASAPPVDDPVVYSRKFDRDARVFGIKHKESGYYLYRGIRYAEPPVGEKRFRRPVPVYLEGDINATRWEAPCLQDSEDGQLIGSEDCLFLNVFTPNLPDATDGYPVVLWIHGGGFRRGASTQYDVGHLIQQRLIVVTIQYRLGSLGFLSSEDENLPGNNGLFDMAVATDWVRNYIEFFGGNPNRITAAGQGTGASSAFLLGLSNYGNDYLSGIVAMSGSLLSRFAVEREPQNITRMIASGNNCPVDQTVEMVRCLREIPASRIIEQDTKFESQGRSRSFVTDLTSLMGTGPVVEGKNDQRSLPRFVQDQPEQSINSDDLPAIPLLTGVVKDETGGAVFGPFKNIITEQLKAFPDFLTKHLIPDLQKIVPTIGDIKNQFVPEAFAKYMDPLGITNGGNKGTKKIDSIFKVGEALNDAIFNAPAFLTVKNWAKKSKAYLYSFDHDSKHGFGRDFLGGLPLVGKSAENGKTSHGDELGYLFSPNNIHGEPIQSRAKFTEEDQRVKDIFTNIIAEFARSGNVTGGDKSKGGSALPFSLPAFSGSGDDDGFLSITSKPAVNKQFRFCEMGLWTGMKDRWTSPLCSLFHVDLANPLQTFTNIFPLKDNSPKLPIVGPVFNTSGNPLEFPKLDLPFKAPVPNLPIPKPEIPNPLSGLGNGVPGLPLGQQQQKPNNGNSQNSKPGRPGGFGLGSFVPQPKQQPTVTKPSVVPNFFG